MSTLPNNDRFGFYTVGDFKTYSKLEAIEHSGVVHQPVEWNFNRDIFSQYDWTQEPPGSLEFWYAERARQIRERYDYIVIWYSGGADSHNVLMSFVNNNIFVDEIAQFHNLEGERGDKKSYLNEEVFTTSGPLTQHLIANNPTYRNTQHRLVDLTELERDVLVKDSNQWDYFYKVNKYLSPNSLARSYMREAIPEYRKLIDQGKSICFVYGAEKPSIKQDSNGWYVGFFDTLDYAVSPRTQMLNRSWEHNELFYWSDSLPQLVAKQAHVIKRFLTQLTPGMIDDVHVTATVPQTQSQETVRSPIAVSVKINQRDYHLLVHGLHKLIYPHWNPNFVVCEKPPSLAYSSRDFWLFRSNAPDLGQKNYNHGLLRMRQIVRNIDPKYWWERPSDPAADRPYSGGMLQLYNWYQMG